MGYFLVNITRDDPPRFHYQCLPGVPAIMVWSDPDEGTQFLDRSLRECFHIDPKRTFDALERGMLEKREELRNVAESMSG